MSAKRRDNKNHILRNGESQRKDGRYMYKYIDNAGNAKHVYCWKLVNTDAVPQGARDDIPYNTYYDRQLNNWLHKYVYKRNYSNEIGCILRKEYEGGKIRTEKDFLEVQNHVLSDSKEI